MVKENKNLKHDEKKLAVLFLCLALPVISSEGKYASPASRFFIWSI